MKKSKGIKFDNTKLRWDLVPWDAIEGLVEILTFGSKKYGDYNWQSITPPHERYFAALMRHLVAWHKGETYDKETGYHHLKHALTNITFLLWFELRGKKKCKK